MRDEITPPALTDRRSLKTRAALLTAFFKLLPERGCDALQVGDICTRPNSGGHSTFYEHLRAKADLLPACTVDAAADALGSGSSALAATLGKT